MSGIEYRDDGISLSTPVIMELIEAVHEKGASFRFQARGHNMTPAIRDGDVITVSPFKDFMLQRGDVLAFRHPEQPQMLVHRVLYVKEKKYFIKGDNCPEADGWIPVENVLGMITKVERAGKARFWPNRSNPSFIFDLYLILYPFWPPLRRLLAKAWHRLRNLVSSGK
ncbi:MAG: signal peptidase I [Candidatus Aminicenantes bacterium]|nr:signal peptidase I [Candidatus Aminicenantes bacterium]